MSETPKELRIGEVAVGVPLHGKAGQLLCRGSKTADWLLLYARFVHLPVLVL